ncbi:MAG: CocE/NonD family hydrolase [Thermoleophilaceae bacterium]
MGSRARNTLVLLVAVAAVALPAPAARAAQVTQDLRFTASDGVSLHAAVGGEGSLAPRPLIVEFSPYAPACCVSYAGPDYNYVQVHIRGTGRSDGGFDTLGERTQSDVAEFLEWACAQPWSDGRIGLYGASASAIAVYHSLHRELPCVETAVLWAGTHELYRDLLYAGGVPNVGPAAGVAALILGMYAGGLPDRLQRDPASVPENLNGAVGTVTGYLGHPTIDSYWRERQVRGDANDLPILMVTGFFDVESRGPFEAFRELRGDGAHLMVIGAHDGVPAGTGGEAGERRRWYDRHLRGIANGIEDEPRVKLWLADGDREDLLAGSFVRADGDDWPIPGTGWEALALGPGGSLGLDPPEASTTQAYPALPSLPFSTDPHTTATLFGFGTPEFSGNALANAFPALTEMGIVESLGLSFSTEPLREDVLSAGPASLELRLASTAPETDIYAVLSDVWPDGSAHPVATGRLRSSFPEIDPARSLTDPETGAIVQPYGRFERKTPAAPGQERLYHVEFWPVGNRFKRGHRLRLHVIGASAYHLPGVPAINTVRVGGPGGSRLLLPVLPGSDLGAALP